MPKPQTSLIINAQQLRVTLGWTAAERQKKQLIWLDIAITFPATPRACLTDHLDDTVCYDHLIADIKKEMSKKPFRLVEHLAYEIYRFTKTNLGKKIGVDVCVTKKPAIKGLSGGVSFQCGDSSNESSL